MSHHNIHCRCFMQPREITSGWGICLCRNVIYQTTSSKTEARFWGYEHWRCIPDDIDVRRVLIEFAWHAAGRPLAASTDDARAATMLATDIDHVLATDIEKSQWLARRWAEYEQA